MVNAILLGMSFIGEIEDNSNALKEKALKEYEEALKMPRKKKKQAKKNAILLYQIACWDNY